LLIIGGTLGAAASPILPAAPPGFWALLGMASMMGGTMRAPLTACLFATELTHNIDTLLPVITACSASYAVTVLLLRRSILTEKIARRGTHVSREYHVNPFSLARVSDVMVTEVDTLPDAMLAADAIAFFLAAEHRHKSYPVLNAAGNFVGIISRGDILRWSRDAIPQWRTIGNLVVQRDALVGYADEMAEQLIGRMIEADVGRVPILDRQSGRLAGLLARKDLLQVHARTVEDEQRRSVLMRWRPARTAGLVAEAAD
jgi:CIC family chloride channel protein